MGELICEVTFCELRCKEIINVVDGKRLGRIIDLVFDLKCGKIIGLVAPGFRRFSLRQREDIFIPWRNVCKLGDDVILVELRPHCGPSHREEPGRNVRRYSAEYEGAEVRTESAAASQESKTTAAPETEARYEQYYDVYDVPDKET